MKTYDICVIGSGGGSKITRPAANLGLKVAIIEKDKLGGTCLNHGCIPSKMLIHPADIASHIKSSERFSIKSRIESVDFTALVRRVNQTIDAESASIAPLYHEHPKIDYYKGTASFTGVDTVSVNGEELRADRFFVAAGCRPKTPDIPGLEDTPYMTYYEALRLEKQPKKLIVIGGGYIACELGYYFSALGTETHLIVRSRLLRGEDREVAEEFTRSFQAQVQLHMGVHPQKVRYDGENFFVDLGGETLTADALFVAAGVTPNSDTLALEKANIETDNRGFIIVDDALRSTNPRVFAFGDIIGRHLFRHTANYEGEYLFKSQVEKSLIGPIHYPPIPHAVFSHPQIGGVGLTEEQCEGMDIVVGTNSYKASAMGMALRSEEGFAKLIFERASKRLIGAHFIGEEASNMIHMAIAYMKMKATLDDLIDTIYIHPALPEIVRNAARKAKDVYAKIPA